VPNPNKKGGGVLGTETWERTRVPSKDDGKNLDNTDITGEIKDSKGNKYQNIQGGQGNGYYKSPKNSIT